MTDYENDDQLEVAARSCSHFRSGGTENNKFHNTAENMSCEKCRHWNGIDCTEKILDDVLNGFDMV